MDKLRDKRCAAERGDQRGNFPSAVLFIASSTPTFCGYSAPSRRRGDAEPHMPSDGSVADGSRGSPKAPGMWYRAPWRRVRAASCPPSHNPSPGVVTWVVTSGRHRWTFIQPHLICRLHRTSPCGGAAGVKKITRDGEIVFEGKLSSLWESSPFVTHGVVQINGKCSEIMEKGDTLRRCPSAATASCSSIFHCGIDKECRICSPAACISHCRVFNMLWKLLLLLCFVQFTQDTVQNGWKVISFLSVSFLKQGASVRPVLVLISLRIFYFTERINTSLTLFGNVCIKSKNHFFLTCTWRRRVTRTAQATLASWAHPLSKESKSSMWLQVISGEGITHIPLPHWIFQFYFMTPCFSKKPSNMH